MIPITVSIFGAKAGTPRGRALALATVYVAGIAAMFGALGTAFALLGKAFGDLPRQPVGRSCRWRCSSWPWGCRCSARSSSRCRSGLQQRLSRVGGKRLRRRVPDGPGRRHHRRAVHGPAAGWRCSPTSRPPATRPGGFALLATYGVGVGLPFWLLAAFSMSLPRPGGWMEWVKSVFGIALFTAALYYLKNVVPALANFTSPAPKFVFGMAAMIVGVSPWARSTPASTRAPARSCARVSASRSPPWASSDRPTTSSRRRSSSPGCRTSGRRSPTPGRRPAGARGLLRQLVPPLQGIGGPGVLPAGGRRGDAPLHPPAGRRVATDRHHRQYDESRTGHKHPPPVLLKDCRRLWKALAGETVEMPDVRRTAAGSESWSWIRLSPLRRADGQVSGVLAAHLRHQRAEAQRARLAARTGAHEPRPAAAKMADREIDLEHDASPGPRTSQRSLAARSKVSTARLAGARKSSTRKTRPRSGRRSMTPSPTDLGLPPIFVSCFRMDNIRRSSSTGHISETQATGDRACSGLRPTRPSTARSNHTSARRRKWMRSVSLPEASRTTSTTF